MKLKKGINLGGYLSQCVHTKEHHDTFIGEPDIAQIAAWGFDHVRVPVDYEVLEDEAGNSKEDGYQYLHNIHTWCAAHGLDMIIDLHKAYGYDFNNAGDSEKNNLFHDAYLQERFVSLWTNIAKAFGNYSDIALELLNEVVENENADAWNKLIGQAVSAIRAVTDAPIIYGGIQWNSAKTLKLLDKPAVENIIYTFHFYEPLIFTHQKAYWVPEMDKERTVSYPESMDYYRTLSKELPLQGLPVVEAKAESMGPVFFQEMMQEAIDAAKAAGVGLYCGEFGVIDQAPAADTARWFKDVYAVFAQFGIGYALWTYKEMDFGITEEHYAPVLRDILN